MSESHVMIPVIESLRHDLAVALSLRSWVDEGELRVPETEHSLDGPTLRAVEAELGLQFPPALLAVFAASFPVSLSQVRDTSLWAWDFGVTTNRICLSAEVSQRELANPGSVGRVVCFDGADAGRDPRVSLHEGWPLGRSPGRRIRLSEWIAERIDSLQADLDVDLEPAERPENLARFRPVIRG